MTVAGSTMGRVWIFTTLTWLTAAGCGGLWPAVVEDREIDPGSSAPRITRVRDVGSPKLPDTGAWIGASDGVVVPGEVLLIEGSNLGRLPTVTLGGRGASILARTEGGGILARVPKGVPAGTVEVVVAHGSGRASATVNLHRLVVLLHHDLLHLVEITKSGLGAPSPPVQIAGAHSVRLHPDGGVAYVLANKRLVVVDLAAIPAPRIVGEIALRHAATQLAASDRAPILVAVGAGQMTFIVAKDALHPSPYEPVPLSHELVGAVAFALSPDGKSLAALVPDGNRLEIFDIEQPRAPKAKASLPLLPEARLPLVRDLAWSVDGETIWVVSGTSTKSHPTVEPTRLSAVRLGVGDEARLSVWRTQVVLGAGAPLRLAIARGQPLASGTTIRTPPEKAAVFVTAVNDQLFRLDKLAGQPSEVAKLWRPPQPGMVVRAALDGTGGPLFPLREIPGALDLTPDSQWLLVASLRVTPTATGTLALDFGVSTAAVFGMPTPIFLRLAAGSVADLKPPFDFAELVVQP